MDHGHLHLDRNTGTVDPMTHLPYPHAALPARTSGGTDMPAVSVYIPTPFRKMTGNRQLINAEGADVAEVLANVDKQFPGFRSLVFGSGTEVPAHINIYLNKQEISSLQGIQTKVNEGDEVAVIPALAGGSGDAPSANGN